MIYLISEQGSSDCLAVAETSQLEAFLEEIKSDNPRQLIATPSSELSLEQIADFLIELGLTQSGEQVTTSFGTIQWYRESAEVSA